MKNMPATLLPKAVVELFNAVEAEILKPVVKLLTGMFPNDLKGLDPVVHDRERNIDAYEDDGNTHTPGMEYSRLWTLPIGREACDPIEEWREYYHGTGQCAVYIHAQQGIRLRDGKAMHTAIFVVVGKYSYDASSHERVDYHPYRFNLGRSKLVRLVQLVDGILATKEIERRVTLLESLQADTES